MPVMRFIPPDPTDLVIQGELMRNAAFTLNIGVSLYDEADRWSPLIALSRPFPGLATSIWPPLLQLGYLPMQSDMDIPERGSCPFLGTMIAANAGIATPCGAWIQHAVGQHLMDAVFVEHTGRWVVAGTTRNSAGVALGDCTLVIEDVGQQHVAGSPGREPNILRLEPQGTFATAQILRYGAVAADNSAIPVVAAGTSDSSGAYSIEVPQNTAYQVTAYKEGSPNRAGISGKDIVPEQM